MASFPQPLFILCPGGSFSSVVCAVIGQHPDAFGLPEVNLFRSDTVGDMMDLATPGLGVPGLLTGVRRTLAELQHGEQTDESVARVNEWLAARRDWPGGKVFAEICRLAAPRLVVEKSPTNTEASALNRLREAFPDARFLHLARHPRGTARSRHKALLEHRRGAPRDHENIWLTRHARIIEFGMTLSPAQYIYLRGEWFLEDPDAVLRQLCDWLDLPVNDEVLARMKRPEDSPFSCYGPKSAATANNRGFLDNPTLRVGKPREEFLEGVLEWTGRDDAYFGEQTVMLANMLGYR